MPSKTHHYVILDLTDDEAALLAEQQTLDANVGLTVFSIRSLCALSHLIPILTG